MFACVLWAPNLRTVVVRLREAAVIPAELLVVLVTLPKGGTLAVGAALLQLGNTTGTDPCVFACSIFVCAPVFIVRMTAGTHPPLS